MLRTLITGYSEEVRADNKMERKKINTDINVITIVTLLLFLSLFSIAIFSPDIPSLICLLILLIFFIAPKWIKWKLKLLPISEFSIEDTDSSETFEIVNEMVSDEAKRLCLKKSPKVLICDDTRPNALSFGNGIGKPNIALTTGLIDLLDAEELLSVIRHELSHLKHKDYITVTFGSTYILLIKYFIPLLLLLYIEDLLQVTYILLFYLFGAPYLILNSLSRSREYLADARAISVGGKQDLINALNKVSKSEMSPFPGVSRLLFFNPKKHFSYLTSTHPPLNKRMQAIQDEIYFEEETQNVRQENYVITSIYSGIAVYFLMLFLRLNMYSSYTHIHQYVEQLFIQEYVVCGVIMGVIIGRSLPMLKDLRDCAFVALLGNAFLHLLFIIGAVPIIIELIKYNVFLAVFAITLSTPGKAQCIVYPKRLSA